MRRRTRLVTSSRPGGFGGFRRGGSDGPRPGPRVDPSEVKTYPDAALYDPAVLRTFFLEFEYPDWEAELEAFHHTDVEVPATLLVDGKKFLSVGVKFRGTGSFNETTTGQKRSFKLKLDNVEKGQALYGYSTLNLNNAFHDPAFMNSVLYSRIARRYVPAPNITSASTTRMATTSRLFSTMRSSDTGCSLRCRRPTAPCYPY